MQMGQFGPIPTTALLQIGQLWLKKPKHKTSCNPLESAAPPLISDNFKRERLKNKPKASFRQ